MTRQPSSIVLVDTSVLLNVLRVPNRSTDCVSVMDRSQDHIAGDDQLLLPIATVLETGNHIAQNGDGTARRECAGDFVEVVRQAAEDSLLAHANRTTVTGYLGQPRPSQ